MGTTEGTNQMRGRTGTHGEVTYRHRRRHRARRPLDGFENQNSLVTSVPQMHNCSNVASLDTLSHNYRGLKSGLSNSFLWPVPIPAERTGPGMVVGSSPTDTLENDQQRNLFRYYGFHVRRI